MGNRLFQSKDGSRVTVEEAINIGFIEVLLQGGAPIINLVLPCLEGYTAQMCSTYKKLFGILSQLTTVC